MLHRHQSETVGRFLQGIHRRIRVHSEVAGAITRMEFLFVRGQRHFDLPELTVIFLVHWGVGERVIIRLLVHDHRHRLSDSIGVVEGFAAGVRGNLVHDSVLGHLRHERRTSTRQVAADAARGAQVR